MKYYHLRELGKARDNLVYLKQLYADACASGESIGVTDNLARQIQEVRERIENLEADAADTAASIKYGF